MREFKDKMIRLGLCDKWKRLWHSSFSQLDILNMGLSMEGIEFLTKHSNDISNDDILSLCGDYINNGYCVSPNQPHLSVSAYVSYKGDIKDYKADILYIKDSNAIIYNNDWKVLQLYVSGNSNIKLILSINNIVNINIFDNSNITIMGDMKTDNNKVTAFVYGDGGIKSFISDKSNNINVINNAILNKEKDR